MTAGNTSSWESGGQNIKPGGFSPKKKKKKLNSTEEYL